MPKNPTSPWRKAGGWPPKLRIPEETEIRLTESHHLVESLQSDSRDEDSDMVRLPRYPDEYEDWDRA